MIKNINIFACIMVPYYGTCVLPAPIAEFCFVLYFNVTKIAHIHIDKSKQK